MAEKRITKGSEEWMMFTDFWQLCQKHWEVELTDDYWEDLISDANDIYAKYSKIPLARQMINAFLNVKEEEYRNLKKKTEG